MDGTNAEEYESHLTKWHIINFRQEKHFVNWGNVYFLNTSNCHMIGTKKGNTKRESLWLSLCFKKIFNKQNMQKKFYQKYQTNTSWFALVFHYLFEYNIILLCRVTKFLFFLFNCVDEEIDFIRFAVNVKIWHARLWIISKENIFFFYILNLGKL